MEYAEVDRLPVAFFFKSRVLKGEVNGIDLIGEVGVISYLPLLQELTRPEGNAQRSLCKSTYRKHSYATSY